MLHMPAGERRKQETPRRKEDRKYSSLFAFLRFIHKEADFVACEFCYSKTKSSAVSLPDWSSSTE